MKSIVLVAPHKFELIEEGRSTLKIPGNVLIKIKSVGVCGSDIHYHTKGRIGDQIITFTM